MSKKIPYKSGDEYDAFGKSRKYYNWKAGELKAIKNRYNRRFRKTFLGLRDLEI